MPSSLLCNEMSELKRLRKVYFCFSLIGPLLVAAIYYLTANDQTSLVALPVLLIFCYLLSFIGYRYQYDSARELRMLLREVKEFRGLVDSTLLVATISVEGKIIFANDLFQKISASGRLFEWEMISKELERQGQFDGAIEIEEGENKHKSLMLSVRPVMGEGTELSHYILFGQVRGNEEILLNKIKASEKALLDVASIQNKYLHEPEELTAFEEIIKSLLAVFKGKAGHFYSITCDKSAKGVKPQFVYEHFYTYTDDSEHLAHTPFKFKLNRLEQTYEYTLNLETAEIVKSSECALKGYLGIFLKNEGQVIGCVGIKCEGFERRFSSGELAALGPFVDMAAILLSSSLSRQKVDSLLTQFEEAQSAAKIGNWYVEIEGYQVTWSDEMYKIFGRDKEMSPPSLEEHKALIHPEDIALWEQSVNDMLEFGSPYRVIFRINLEGREVWLETNARAIVDEKGKTIAAFGTTQDVTEARELLAENVRKEQTLSTILRYVPLSLMTLMPSGECGYVNKEWSRLTGAQSYETLGRKWMDFIYEDDLEAIQSRLDSLGTRGANIQKFELRVVNPKENQIRTTSAQLIRMSASEESESGYLLTLLDITEIKRSEREVNKALNRLELALYSGELGLWDWNLTTNEVTYDDRWCSMLGYRSSEIDPTITGFSSLVHPDDYDMVLNKFDQFLCGELSDYEVIVRMKHKDGTWIPVLSKGKVIERRDDGTPRRFTGTHLDFTRQAAIENELREAKERAERMTRVKTVFLANMSHEIRSPLNGIVGMAELLEAYVSDVEGIQYLRSIQSCSETLLRIIGDILDYSKMEEGRFDINVGRHNLKDIAYEVVQSFEGIKRKKNIGFHFSCDSTLDQDFLFDSVRVRQIFFNLLSNAFKFTLEGEVSLKLSEESKNGNIIIEVGDTGVGIAKEDEHLLFERFSQIDSGMTKSAEGTGLGLVIVKNLASLMGGSVSYESTRNLGTTFIVRLPLKKASISSLEVGEENAVISTPAIPILVAEDNPINQALMKKLLEKSGHQVTLVSNGEEVLAALDGGETFALILMDLQMPKMDGLSATRILKERFNDCPPVVAVTANVFEEDREACVSVGMEDFLSKPIRRTELDRVVSKYALRWSEGKNS